MVSSSPAKNNRKEEITQNVNKSPVVNNNNNSNSSSKPLRKYKFYLDIKNNNTTKKLEGNIKQLGGVLELFLTKEVTHVITDREEWYKCRGVGSNPRALQGTSHDTKRYNESNVSPKFKTGSVRPKTRADAMLEKAQKSTTNNQCAKNPLDNAKLWGVTIWTVNKAITWIENIFASITIKRKEVKLFQLKTPYLKFEAFDRQTRPIFKEIHNWPELNLDGSVGDPGLICRSGVERNMTRKTRSHQPRFDTALQPGYCEVCRADYPRLDKHLESDKHQSYISNSANFLELDALINEGTNIQSFLNLNHITIDEKNIKLLDTCTGPITRNKMPRTRTASLLSPTENDIIHKLRPRMNITNNYVATTAVDDNQPLKHEGAKESRELRSSARLSNMKNSESNENHNDAIGKPKRNAVKRKHLSPDERLVVDNKTYYKVEVMSSKLRSSGHRKEVVTTYERIPEPIPENCEVEKDDKGLVVKFKRMRMSELEQLNNEAENFLFPRKEESSSEDDIDADNPNTTASTTGVDTSIALSSEDEKPLSELKHELEDSSMDSNWSDTSNSRKKKRRTHAEAFILDNQKYYKFETPGSRLRYHGSFMPQIPVIKSPKSNGECLIKTVNRVQEDSKRSKSTKKDDNTNFTLEDFKFSFESVPKSEPWYQTFQRQDEGQEYYTCFSDSGYWKPFLLPYQLPPIPPLDPKVCIQTYEEIKKQIIEAKSTTTSTSCSTPDPSCASGSDVNNFELHEDNSKASDDSLMRRINEKLVKKGPPPKKRVKKVRKGILMPTKNPRKSPRQHASTLAILSSLIHQRKRRDLNKSKTSDEEDSKNLSSIPEEAASSSSCSVPLTQQTNHELVAKTLNDMFSNTNKVDEIEISVPMESNRVINVSYNADAIQALDDFENDLVRGSPKSGKNQTPKRRPGRKKKKNRTGWPKTKKLILKKGFKDNLDESTVDSLGANENECDDKLLKTEIISSDENSINKPSKTATATTTTSTTTTASSKRNESMVYKNDINNKVDNNLDDDSEETNSVQNDNENNMNNNTSDNEDRVNNREHTPHHQQQQQHHQHHHPIQEIRADNCNNKQDSLSNNKCVDIDKWENAEKVLSAKLTNTDTLNSDFQPYVKIQKISDVNLKQANNNNRKTIKTPSPRRTPRRPRRMPASPKSPRILRRPRGRWYRER